MALTKYRKYTDEVQNNFGPIVATATSPFLVDTHTASVTSSDSFLRLRWDFSIDFQVAGSGQPPEVWWPVTKILMIASWSPVGTAAVVPSFGSSEHFLGSKLLTPRLTRGVINPTSEYVVQYSADEPLVAQTARKGDGVHMAKVNVGFTAYDPYNALDGTYPGIACDYQGHLFTLWGAAP